MYGVRPRPRYGSHKSRELLEPVGLFAASIIDILSREDWCASCSGIADNQPGMPFQENYGHATAWYVLSREYWFSQEIS
jgi:hypothetical protein